MTRFDVPINSNLFNTLEYVVFDVVLAIFVYVLTSKLVGLYNCYDALKNHPESHICEDTSAPLFDSGIVCTRKKVFYAIVAVRIVSWILIFCTNLLIRGRSEKIIETSTASVVTLGRFSQFDPPLLLRQRQVLRKTCVGRTENSSYYGEIRNGNCEIDLDLLSEPIVKFGFEFEPTFVSVTGCRPRKMSIARHQYFRCNGTAITAAMPKVSNVVCTYNTSDGVISDDSCFQSGTNPFTPCVRTVPKEQKYDVPFRCGAGRNARKLTCYRAAGSRRNYSMCDNAVIACINKLDGLDCQGLVNINATTHMCENLQLGDQQNPNALCKRASGAEWNITDWLPFHGNDALDSISNVVAVAYGSGVERRQVKQYEPKERSLTSVDVLWTTALALKIIMVIALYMVCELFRRRHGVFVVANDEPRILSLLGATVTRIRQGRTTRTANDNINLRVSLRNDVVRLYDE